MDAFEQTYLCASVGRTEEVRDGGSRDGTGGTGASTLDGSDGRDGDLLLTETRLDVGHNGGDDDDLGNHF